MHPVCWMATNGVHFIRWICVRPNAAVLRLDDEYIIRRIIRLRHSE